MISKIITFLILFGTLFSFFTGKTDLVATAILTESAEAITLITTLAGGLCFWSGLMEIASRTNLTEKLCIFISPLTKLLFPKLKKGSEALQYISINMISNLLGLGNAATPFGIKAIKALTKEEHSKTYATDYMIVFVVLNTASFQLIPTSIAMIRTRYGSADPFSIIPAVWLATLISLFCGLAASYLLRRKNKYEP